jgi:hypothetical protein
VDDGVAQQVLPLAVDWRQPVAQVRLRLQQGQLVLVVCLLQGQLLQVVCLQLHGGAETARGAVFDV